MKRFCESLREYAKNRMKFKKKKIKLLAKEQQESMKSQKSVTLVKNNLKINTWKIKML